MNYSLIVRANSLDMVNLNLTDLYFIKRLGFILKNFRHVII